ncbi:MAG TPA: hypothetical protein VJU84_03390 [Pyrinomonadaceae bacterium]|nr:hypothetical protein [Pyrinomonadaceae bacterium]
MTYFYRSPDPYEEVKNFYSNALLPKGIGPFEEDVPKWFMYDVSKQIKFKRAEFSVVIEHDASSGAAVPYSFPLRGVRTSFLTMNYGQE